MSIYIKKFNDLTNRELYEIVKARFEVFVCEQKIVCENDFDDRDKEGIHLFLLKDGGIVEGYLRILPRGVAYEDSAAIGRMIIRKEARNIGLAKTMLKDAISYIKENLEEDNITVSAQNYVKGLYESVGFEAVSDVYNEASIEHVKMILKK